MKTRLLLINFIVLLVLSQSCESKKGNARIKGKIYAVTLNADGSTGNDTIYASKRMVYLIPLNDSIQKTKDKTGKKGGFKFNNLSKGRYLLKVYSKSRTTQKTDSIITSEINVTNDRQMIKLKTLVIYI